MKVSSQQLTVSKLFNGRSPIATLKDAADLAFGAEATPIRVAVTSKSRAGHLCEIEAVEPKVYGSDDTEANVFEYRQRRRCHPSRSAARGRVRQPRSAPERGQRLGC